MAVRIWLSNDADKEQCLQVGNCFIDPSELILMLCFPQQAGEEIKVNEQRDRDGFGLTDHGATTL